MVIEFMEATTGIIPVFVYGTLKRGHANHRWLATARWHGPAAMEGLRLHDLGPFPMAVQVRPQEAPCWLLQGELVWVDQACLAQLDQLEAVPRLYRRLWWPLVGAGMAWVYVGSSAQVRHSPVLAAGLWLGPGAGRRRPRAALAQGAPG
jgi:gamma-glutamylcyclotransferase (GGCT)/AIG2-like uncharacterized protein YtfP